MVSFTITPAAVLGAAEVKATGQTEWDKTIEAARGRQARGRNTGERRVTEEHHGEFKSRFPGIELELTTSRGPTNASKISAEHAAGVRYFDLLISGTSTPFNLLSAEHSRSRRTVTHSC